jgi:hypothetical protein
MLSERSTMKVINDIAKKEGVKGVEGARGII